MSTTFHLRWAHEHQLPPKAPPGQRSTYNVRPFVAGADPVVLEIDATAVDILCNVCGESLRPPQRDALLLTLRDVVSNVAHRPTATGPLSQAGEMCAILGLAQFALRSPDPWLFVRIPESSDPRPDIFALSPGGQPWYLELKGAAKLASQVKPLARLNTCKNIRDQVAKAGEQLKDAASIGRPASAPDAAIQADQGVPSFAAAAGGKALSMVVLADAALLSLPDVLPEKSDGCPPGKSCAQECLCAPAAIPETSIVGLLWTEKQPVPAPVAGRPDRLTATLVALKALDLAAWAGSPAGARESLAGLAETLSDGALEVGAEDAARVMSAGLQVSRGLVHRAARRAAAEQVATRLLESPERPEPAVLESLIVRLFEEVDAGLPSEAAPEAVPLAQAFRRAADGSGIVHVAVQRTEGLELAGVLRGRTLRLAPRLSELRRWVSRESEGRLLDAPPRW